MQFLHMDLLQKFPPVKGVNQVIKLSHYMLSSNFKKGKILNMNQVSKYIGEPSTPPPGQHSICSIIRRMQQFETNIILIVIMRTLN